jgi:hypothetical protein
MTMVSGSDVFQTAYDNAGVGGLTGEVFKGYSPAAEGFGMFIQVLLSFSVVGVVVGKSKLLGYEADMANVLYSEYLLCRS